MIGSRFFHTLIFSVAVIVVGLCVSIGAIRHIVGVPFQTSADTFFIPSGQSIAATARQARDQGLVRRAFHFRLAVRYLDMTRQFHAGEFRINFNDSILILFDRIRRHEVVQRPFVVPEGLSVVQIVDRLKQLEFVAEKDVALPQEGRLLPDTYHYVRGETAATILQRMEAAMAETLQQEWQMRQEGLPLTSMEEALVLASIVEKETAVASERPLVAAVFINRLRQNMRLQSDPTVIYGITKGEPLGRPISRADLKKTTPYNTYRVNGLPPTPIANPGIESIRSVLHPAGVPYLYFVADGSGGHAFATTLAEHNGNVARWRRLQRGSR